MLVATPLAGVADVELFDAAVLPAGFVVVVRVLGVVLIPPVLLLGAVDVVVPSSPAPNVAAPSY